MRIAVTGWPGFIGGHLVQKLAATRTGQILVLDNLQRPCVEDLEADQGNVRFVRSDIRNCQGLSRALEAYGEPDRPPVSESFPLNPKNAYGASKAAGEVSCRLAAAEGMETVILRLANVYGPREPGRVIPLVPRLRKGTTVVALAQGDNVAHAVLRGSAPTTSTSW